MSIPAPAYYAHLVAFRARYHLVEKDHDSGEGSAQSSNGGGGGGGAGSADGGASTATAALTIGACTVGSATGSQSDRNLSHLSRAVAVHPDASHVMYFA